MYPHTLDEVLRFVQRYVRWAGLASTPPTATPMGFARHHLPLIKSIRIFGHH